MGEVLHWGMQNPSYITWEMFCIGVCKIIYKMTMVHGYAILMQAFPYI